MRFSSRAWLLYQSNGDTYVYTYDSAPNSLLVLNALENHRLDFENFRGGYLFGLGAGYAFADDKHGRLTSFFPVGTAILSAPLYLAFDPLIHLQHQPSDVTSPGFERYRLHYEKLAANWIAAFAAVLLFLCARRLTGLVPALIVTLAFAAGTDMWTVGCARVVAARFGEPARARHDGSVVRGARRAPVTPHAALAGAGRAVRGLPLRGAADRARLQRRGTGVCRVGISARRVCFSSPVRSLASCRASCGTKRTFGTLLGAYAQNADAYVFTWQQFSNAFAALLISPGKGLVRLHARSQSFR